MGWSSQAAIANLVIIEGSSDGLFVYSGQPGKGTLIASIASAGGTDSYGNAYGAGFESYLTSTEHVQMHGAGIDFLNGDYLPGNIAESGAGALSIRSGLKASTDTEAQVSLRGLNGTTQVVVVAGASVSPQTPALLEVQGDMALTEQASAPATPAGAGILYVDSTGHLHYLGPNGTDTILANP